MKRWIMALGLLAACAGAQANTETWPTKVWQPADGITQTPLWPGTPPNASPMPAAEQTRTSAEAALGNKPVTGVKNISLPTMAVYPAKGTNTGAAVVVFPGGGFEMLAIDFEGTEVCDWLTARGVTCVVLKYRVPSLPYDWHCNCRPHNLQIPVQALTDAQRALRLVRANAAQWHVDPHKIGVLGFSAGGFLVAEASTQYKRHLYAPVDDADKESARPDFALAIYPGHLTLDDGKLNKNVPVTSDTPPTFILQAEDDHVDGVEQALVYFTALKDANVPAEMHLYAQGGHAFGLRPTANPITHWTALADTWMQTIGMVPSGSH